MAEEKPKPKFKRRPLGRTLGKRRLGKKDGDEEEAKSGEDQPDSEAKDDSSPSSEADDPAEDSTLPLPNAGSPGAALTPPVGPSLGEQASVRKAAMGRFFKEFFAFMVEFVQWVASGGKRSWSSVVLPFSKALVDAAVSMCLILLTLVIGILLGRYLHPVLDPPPGAEQRRGHPFPVTSTPLPTVHPEQTTVEAQAALERFMEAIDGGAYQSAYGLLSPGWRKELPYSTFEQGFAPTDSIRFSVKEAIPLGQDRVQLEVGLEVMENGKPRRYQGTYVAVKTGEGWRLDSGSLR